MLVKNAPKHQRDSWTRGLHSFSSKLGKSSWALQTGLTPHIFRDNLAKPFLEKRAVSGLIGAFSGPQARGGDALKKGCLAWLAPFGPQAPLAKPPCMFTQRRRGQVQSIKGKKGGKPHRTRRVAKRYQSWKAVLSLRTHRLLCPLVTWAFPFKLEGGFAENAWNGVGGGEGRQGTKDLQMVRRGRMCKILLHGL